MQLSSMNVIYKFALVMSVAAAFQPHKRIRGICSSSFEQGHLHGACNDVGAVRAPLTSTYHDMEVTTTEKVQLVNITGEIQSIIDRIGLHGGQATINTKHTTTAIIVNEMETRLLDDIKEFLARLVPPDLPYKHNDLHLRFAPSGYEGGDEQWRRDEPINAHAHFVSILLGATKTIPVHEGKLALGAYQSIIMVEMDGPRNRTVGVHLLGS